MKEAKAKGLDVPRFYWPLGMKWKRQKRRDSMSRAFI